MKNLTTFHWSCCDWVTGNGPVFSHMDNDHKKSRLGDQHSQFHLLSKTLVRLRMRCSTRTAVRFSIAQYNGGWKQKIVISHLSERKIYILMIKVYVQLRAVSRNDEPWCWVLIFWVSLTFPSVPRVQVRGGNVPWASPEEKAGLPRILSVLHIPQG